MKFRPIRAEFDDAMEEMREFYTRNAFFDFIYGEMRSVNDPRLQLTAAPTIEVKFYHPYDDRAGWEAPTYIVLVDNMPMGYTDEPLEMLG